MDVNITTYDIKASHYVVLQDGLKLGQQGYQHMLYTGEGFCVLADKPVNITGAEAYKIQDGLNKIKNGDYSLSNIQLSNGMRAKLH